MPPKPVFTEDQFDILHRAAERVFRKHFKDQPKPQIKMALALGISQQSVSKLLNGEYRPGVKVATELAILDGKEDLEDLVGKYARTQTAAPPPEEGGFGNLEICIQFHLASRQWSPWTIAAARAGFFGPTDFSPPEWPAKLDHLEKALQRARKAN